jgi:probable phosphoglycerate mutase
MTRRRVYLMRHAEVRYTDVEGRFVHPDGVPLTDEGRRQGQAVGAALAAVPFDRAVTSGLPRTVDTAAHVLAGRGPVPEALEALHEIRPGGPGAVAPAQFEATFLRALHRPVSREDQFLGGETWGSLQDRVLPCFRALLGDAGWHHLLVVAHGGVNRVILLDALGATLESLDRIEQDPAALNILDVDGDGHVLVRLINHTAYDTAKAGLRETTMERLFKDLALGLD